jgi:hypothetical protein
LLAVPLYRGLCATAPVPCRRCPADTEPMPEMPYQAPGGRASAINQQDQGIAVSIAARARHIAAMGNLSGAGGRSISRHCLERRLDVLNHREQDLEVTAFVEDATHRDGSAVCSRDGAH